MMEQLLSWFPLPHNSGLPTSVHWVPSDKFRLFICENDRMYTRLCPLIQKMDQCAVSFFAYRQQKWEATLKKKNKNQFAHSPLILNLLLRSHLSERRPFLFLLHIRIITCVGRFIAGVTVGMEHISCAEFIDRSKSNTWSIPETHGAVFMTVNWKKKKRQKKNMMTEVSVSSWMQKKNQNNFPICFMQFSVELFHISTTDNCSRTGFLYWRGKRKNLRTPADPVWWFPCGSVRKWKRKKPSPTRF